MAYPVIDQKTESHSYVVEKVTTTLTLVETAPGQFGILYEAKYSGVKDGHVSGGPLSVSGNGEYVVNKNPEITVTISNYSNTGSNISMQIKIYVNAYGGHTIFNQALGGSFGGDPVKAIFDNMTELYEKNALKTA
ncbi:hypothetical protein ACFSUS_26685 [Spirosoma soli]|uniref:Jacalin-type lectin domain-containing protein n=1 Tax=Spirosoma soli TaxID=1770529 RepID=A0ABW5MB40_9BACT